MTNNENMDYLKRVREEIEMYYNGFEEDEEEKTLFDYLANVLDYEIAINSSFEYSSCKVWVTLGGPNIWIDTASNEIKLAWGCERAELWLPSEICDEINDYFEELYNCRQARKKGLYPGSIPGLAFTREGIKTKYGGLLHGY